MTAPSRRVRFHDLLPREDTSLRELIAGLGRTPKELPPKYFYDGQGCVLFERICELPEYYLTRAELQLMARHAADMGAFLGPGCELIEFGCGSGRKTRLLLEALRPLHFVPVDIAAEALHAACDQLEAAFPELHISAVCADFASPIAFPERLELSIRRRAVYFPGSTVGNFTRDEALGFLRQVREWVGEGGGVVIGVDVKKSPAVLHAAYNDAAGVTAAFNLNLLAHVNSAYGADFDLDAFEHVAFYDEAQGRIEMHLRSLRSQQVRLAGRRFDFSDGELMRTEISCKYAIEEFVALAGRAGFDAAHVWQDDGMLFAVYGLVGR